MQSLNSQYRGVDKVTDVLSFPMADDCRHEDTPVLGDIVVCIPQVLRQAKVYENSFHAELLRLLVHGLLHLIGYDHERNRYQKKKMEKKEGELLNAISKVA